MAGDQNVALMFMQVLIEHISGIENEFMTWFHVFFLDNVIEIGQLMGYFEKPREYLESRYQNESRNSRSPNKNDWKLQVPYS